MQLFLVKGKKAVCLSMITVLILLGMKGAYYNFGQNTPKFCHAAGSGAAQVSGEYDEPLLYSCSLWVTCSTESMMLEGKFYGKVNPAKAEIYRAEVKSNGKNGKFKKIGSCKKFMKQEFIYEYTYEPNIKVISWVFNYKDNTVKTGKSYAYKYKAYCKTEGGKDQYQTPYSGIKRGMAANTVGKYTCTIVKSTAKDLVVKLTGKSKKNGLLEAQYSPGIDSNRYGAELRYKNDGENEICRHLDLVGYSYNGKIWHYGRFSIQGKQSVYLHFKEHCALNRPANGIKFSNYQHAQMFYYAVKYNRQYRLYDRCDSPQIRFNLSSGTAAVSNFTSYKNGQVAFVWEGDIFTRDYFDLD